MKVLTHFETSLISGGYVSFNEENWLVTITENLESFTLTVEEELTFIFVRGNDGMVSASCISNGITVTFPSESNLFNGQVGKYQFDFYKLSA